MMANGMYDKVILTDVDGVLLNWEYAFTRWMVRHGYKRNTSSAGQYIIKDLFKVRTEKEWDRLVNMFNESASAGFIPPFRDSIHYVQKLHREHGYVFHAITSFSTLPEAQELRKKNLCRLFGETVFERFVFLDRTQDKWGVLGEYANTDYWWVEDDVANAKSGVEHGLRAIVMKHTYNLNDLDTLSRSTDWPFGRRGVETVSNWKEITLLVTGER